MLWWAVEGAISCYFLGAVLLADAIHCIVFCLVQEDCRFFAASFMVWMYRELPESPVLAYLCWLRNACFATECAERACHGAREERESLAGTLWADKGREGALEESSGEGGMATSRGLKLKQGWGKEAPS